MSAAEALSADQQRKRDELASRLFRTCLDALDIWAIYLGDRLGYYAALAREGPATSGELAARTATHERYAREWLEQQAASGILAVDAATADARERQYRLEPGHAEVFLDPMSLSYLVSLVRYYIATVPLLPRVLEAYRTGGGLPWSEMGQEVVLAQEAFNRPIYTRFLATENLPSMPDVDARLKADPPARVADLGCGAGWAGIAVARAYPKVRVHGFDFDRAAIEIARRNAVEAGVADRVTFEARDATSLPEVRYDLALVLECLHDVPYPVAMLRAVRERLAEGGTVVVMDERVGEAFSAPAGEVDRMMYGWSIVQCLPGAMAHPGATGTGAVMRPSTLRHYAEDAGFRAVEVLPIDNDPIRRWYRLRL